MISVSRGDVVLVLFPFTDASGAKKRPAVVIQSDAGNRRLNAVILALVTGNTQRAPIEPTQTLIDIATSDGAQTGLLRSSAIKCEHLATIHKDLIDRVIGRLSPRLQAEVDRCLKASLELT